MKALKQKEKKQEVAPAKLRSLVKVLRDANRKIDADLFRFRTCCADPRASK